MTRIAPVHLAYNPKTLWFDARDLELAEGDPVVVLTTRGLEFGRMAADPFEADDDQVRGLRSPLKPVKRKASDEDVERAADLERKSAEALPVFRELAASTNEEMHPVAVEYLFDGEKAVFYFEAENRIDFRGLVRKLASRFRVRVDMRQIGVRDEARMVGGLGHCGQELCCKRFGGDFNPVSIRMAKEQDLSLNPQKISGMCGRLMCCLRYECEAYEDFKSRAPKQNQTVDTPDGPLKVTALDVPREIVTVRTEEGKSVKVPLADMDEPEGEGRRRTVIGEEAWECACDRARGMLAGGTFGAFSTPRFTRSDKLEDARARVRDGAARSGKPDLEKAEEGEAHKRRRRRSTKVEGGGSPKQERGKQAKKRLASGGAGGAGAVKKKGMQPRRRPKQDRDKQDRAAAGKGQGGSQQHMQGRQRPVKGQGGPRPGQKSSGLQQSRSLREAEGSRRTGAARFDAPKQAGAHRSSRRRSHKAGSPQEGPASGLPRSDDSFGPSQSGACDE